MHFEDPETQAAAERNRAQNASNVTPIKKAKVKSNTKAAKAEANGDAIEFEFDGKSYEIEPAEEWDIEVMEFFADGRLVEAIRLLLGEKQYLEFKTDSKGQKVKRKMADLGEFLETAMAQLGVEPGESNS